MNLFCHWINDDAPWKKTSFTETQWSWFCISKCIHCLLLSDIVDCQWLSGISSFQHTIVYSVFFLLPTKYHPRHQSNSATHIPFPVSSCAWERASERTSKLWSQRASEQTAEPAGDRANCGARDRNSKLRRVQANEQTWEQAKEWASCGAGERTNTQRCERLGKSSTVWVCGHVYDSWGITPY